MTPPSRQLGREVSPWTVAAALGLLHALVDAASLAILFGEALQGRLSNPQLIALTLLYNCLAFGLQAPLGALADALRGYRGMTVAGLLLSAAAISISPAQAWVAVVAIGLGNAMFHAAAGGAVLRASPGRASEIGVFIGPGAVGVLAGIWLGSRGVAWREPMLIALAVAAVLVAVAPAVRTRPAIAPAGAAARAARWELAAVAILLLVAVSARSLLGGAITGLWASAGVRWSAALVAAAVAGKMLGGVLADRLGWRRVATVSMLALAAAILPAAVSGASAVTAAMLVQIGTGVCAAGLLLAMPRRPGLAFGLASLAILAGGLPRMAGWSPIVSQLLVIVAGATGVLLTGLSLLHRKNRRADTLANFNPTAAALPSAAS